MHPWPYALPAAIVFGISVLATWIVRRLAQQRGWVEQPRPDRWHRVPRAKLGGVAIFIALMAGMALFAPARGQVLGLALLATFMFGVGLADDFVSLRPQTKLVLQIAAALTLYLVGYHFYAEAPFWLDLAFVLLWVVGITNAMNLLDNMDGLAAGIAVIAGGFRFLLYLTDGNPDGALLSAIFVGAVAGFLVFNFSPASIFMGDGGAFLIGFFLATINLTTTQTYAKSLISILLFPVLVLAIPIFDTTLVSVVRWFSGRRVSQGGADHTSHRLVAVGLSERQAVLILYGIAVASGVVAYVLYRVGFSYALLGVALVTLGLVLFGIFLGSVAVYPSDRLPTEVAAGARPTFSLATEVLFKRSMLWIVVDVLTILLAYFAAYLLRFGGTVEWTRQSSLFVQSAPIVVAAVLVALFARGLYRSEWRHFSLYEVRIIVVGVVAGLVTTVLLVTYLYRFEGYSRSVFVLTGGAAVLALAGSRAFVRTLADALRPGREAGQRVLIYGAGAAGELALAEIQMNRALDQVVVGYLDDDVFKQRSSIRGMPVLGGLDALPLLVKRHRINAIVVSSGKIGSDRLGRLAEIADEAGLSVFRVSISMVPMKRTAR